MNYIKRFMLFFEGAAGGEIPWIPIPMFRADRGAVTAALTDLESGNSCGPFFRSFSTR